MPRFLSRLPIDGYLLALIGMVVLAALQTFYGLLPLRKLRLEIARMRGGRTNRVGGPMPNEVAPMVEELNALVAHNETQAEEARRHAGNLAHALKTPISVMLAEAGTSEGDLPELVRRQTRVMQGQVRIGRPLGVAGLPESAKGPAFAVATGLLVYPQAAHLEHFEPRRTRQLMTGTGYIARVGRWLRESF